MKLNKDATNFIELIRLAQTVVDKAEINAAMNPSSEQIQVVIVEPNKKPYKKIIENRLEAMNDIVGGYIEIVRMGQHTSNGAELIITVNEEGKLMRLPLNRIIAGFDTLVGTFFISAANMQGDNVTIDDTTAAKIIKQFTPIEVSL
jgi:Domain of unknown function (DUF3846)